MTQISPIARRSDPTQNNLILHHLQTGHSLTPLEALDLFGCFRLSGRILELRKQGYAIVTHMKQIGEKRVAEYSL